MRVEIIINNIDHYFSNWSTIRSIERGTSSFDYNSKKQQLEFTWYPKSNNDNLLFYRIKKGAIQNMS